MIIIINHLHFLLEMINGKNMEIMENAKNAKIEIYVGHFLP